MDVPTGVLQCCTPSTDKKLSDTGSAAQCGDKLEARLAAQMENAVRDEENFAVVPTREETLFSSTAGEWLTFNKKNLSSSPNFAAEDCCMVPETPPQNSSSALCVVKQVFSKGICGTMCAWLFVR